MFFFVNTREIIFLTRRTLFTCIATILFHDSMSKQISMLFACVGSLLLHDFTRMFHNDIDNFLQTTQLACLTLIAALELPLIDDLSES